MKLAREVRTLPRSVWPLLAGTLINRFGSFVLVFLVLYVRSRGYSTAAAGGAVAAYGVGALAAAAVGGTLADTYGRRNSIVVSMVGSAVAMLALWQASSLATILAFAAVAGLFSELYRPAASALLADLLPREQRLVGFAVYRLAINLGMALGPAAAGLMARTGFSLLFVGDALTSLGCAAIAFVWLPHGLRGRIAGERRGEALRTIRRDVPFLFFLAASLIGALVYDQTKVTLPLAVVDDGHGRAFFGLLMSLNSVLVTFTELPLTTLTRRLPTRLPIALGYLLVAGGVALTGAGASVGLLVLSVVVWTVGEMAFAPVAQAHVAEVAPDHLRGRYAAAAGLTSAVAGVAGPVAGTVVYAWRPQILWLGCLGAGVIAALLVARSRPRPVAEAVDAGDSLEVTPTT